MSEEKALEPVDQRIVSFYGDEITAVLVEVAGEQRVFVPLRPICDLVGVDWSAQRQRLNRDLVLSGEIRGVVVTPSPLDSKYANPQEMTCLPLDYLNGWLFGINANRVKNEDIRDRLVRYQRECYQVLANAFLERTQTAVSPAGAALAQIREMGLAIARVAEELMVLEQRTATTESRLDRAAEIVGQMNRRLSAVERQVRAGTLTEEQAVEIKKRVNLIAQELTEREPGKVHYPSIYAALGDETGATSYKSIPPAAFETAVEWLDNWLQALRESD